MLILNNNFENFYTPHNHYTSINILIRSLYPHFFNTHTNTNISKFYSFSFTPFIPSMSSPSSSSCTLQQWLRLRTTMNDDEKDEDEDEDEDKRRDPPNLIPFL